MVTKKTLCPIHGMEDRDKDEECHEADCDKREWCFVVSKDKVEILRYTESELKEVDGDCCDMVDYVLAGIAKFMEDRRTMVIFDGKA